MNYYYIYSTQIGDIYIESDGIDITDVRTTKLVPINAVENEILVIRQAYTEITQYLSGERKTFSLSLSPKGSNFNLKVFKALLDIPYGTTATYKEIATILGNSQASRAVGNACRKNPILLLIPCHRVIGSSGSLVGFAGGLDIKKKLLELESSKQN